MTVKAFLKEQIRALSKQYEVTLVVNTEHTDFSEQNALSAKVVPLVIERAINPAADLRALCRLVNLFRQHRFDLVHSVTPKAGLLAMLAGRIAGVPFRIHTFTGQVWVTRHGVSRILLKNMDRLLAASATHLLADSASQCQFLIDQSITQAEKITVLADGSISGVDSERFRPNDVARAVIRNELGVSDDDILLLFLGRLNRDKGVLDLAEAFKNVASNKLHLLLVGPDEGGLKSEIKHTVGAYTNRLHFVDYTDKPESWFAAVDIFCLPSSVIIEAAACAVPAIGSDIYGISDAIKDGETGLLVPAGDSNELATAIKQMVSQPERRREMGQAALMRARKDFSVQRLVHAWLDYYGNLQ